MRLIILVSGIIYQLKFLIKILTYLLTIGKKLKTIYNI